MKQISKSLLTFISSICLLLAFGSCHRNVPKEETAPIATDTIPMLVTQILKCARLYTTEYHIHKIITHKDNKKIEGTILGKKIDIDLPLGERHIAIPIDATVKSYVDLSSFSERNIIRDGRKIKVLLPEPKIAMTSSRIDHQGIRQDISIIRSKFTDEELTDYLRQGRAAILRDIPKMRIRDISLRHAAQTILPFFTSLGFDCQDITITFCQPTQSPLSPKPHAQ